MSKPSTKELLLDSYERQTRLFPGLFALLPISITIAALGVRKVPPLAVGLGLLSAAGGPVLLADFVHEQGIAMQKRLLAKWGGFPTTRALRLRQESWASATQRDKWRKALHDLTGHSLPTLRAESDNPDRADEVISSAVDDLRGILRGNKSLPLIDKENRNYGQRRNRLGIRRCGIFVASSCTLLSISFLLAISSFRHKPTDLLVASVLNGLALAGWLNLPTEEGMKGASEKYAFELFQGAVYVASHQNRGTKESR